jgi:hypothetical protein
MEEGEEGAEIQDQGLAHATAASHVMLQRRMEQETRTVRRKTTAEINSMWSGMM